LQLADMACRCGLRHCSAHRLPETHGCTFDHKAHDRAVLETQVVRCVADKLKEDRI
jgi:predicted nucleic acid binding AN1-type Zn finger protein